MMKRTILAVLVIFILLGITACNNEDEIKGKGYTATVDTLTERVVGVTYRYYDFENGANALNSYDTLQAGGCSAIVVELGNKVYVGRNYDFYCTDTPAFVVYNNAGKYRTIGFGSVPAYFSKWKEDYTLSDDVLSILPYLCCDVMSENGIYIETNIRLKEKDLICTSTKEGAIRRCTQTFMQYMLANYSTIDEIVSHINDFDWFDLSKIGYEQAFLLTDSTGYSVCIEFAANGWSVTESDCNANYFINPKYYEKENYPIGEMRIEKLKEARKTVKTEKDIFNMMDLVAYSQFSSSSCDLDFAIGEYIKDIGYTRFNIEENRETARTKVKEILDRLNGYTWQQRVEKSCWESTFTAVANISEKKIKVRFSEHYEIYFTVSFR